MTMKSVLLNKNFLLSGDSLPSRGGTSASFAQKGISFFSMIRDVVQHENGRLAARLPGGQATSSLTPETGQNNGAESVNSPIESVRRAFLAKGIPLDQVVLDQKDFESLRSILDKLDFPRASIDTFFQQMVQDNPERKTTLSDFFEDFSKFENDMKSASSSRSGDVQSLSLDKSLVPHIESALRELGVTPETLDSLLPSVSDGNGNVDLKKLTHQLKEIQASPASSDAAGTIKDHDSVLSPRLLEAMESMELPTPRQSIGVPFSLDNLIGVMETKIKSVSVDSKKSDVQDATVMDEVSEISEKQSMDNGQVESFFAFAEAMMVRQHFESRRNFQESGVGGGRNSMNDSVPFSEAGLSLSDQTGQAGNTPDFQLGRDDFQSILRTGASDSSSTIQFSQAGSGQISAGKDGMADLGLRIDSQVLDGLRIVDGVAAVFKNIAPPVSQPPGSMAQAELHADKFPRSSFTADSASQDVSTVIQSLPKGSIEIPRENLASTIDAKVMETAIPDQTSDSQDVLRGVKGNKYSLENRSSLPWNKVDGGAGGGMGPQMIAGLNGSPQNGNSGVSKEIDLLIDDILSGTVNSKEKVILSIDKSVTPGTSGGSERFSMVSQTNASTANSLSQKDDSPVPRFPPHVVETVGKEIATFLQRGDRILKLQLKPAELGTVNIEMDTKENVVKLSIVAETSSARELFLSNHNELRRVLEGHGIRLENLDVQMNDTSGQSMSNGNHQSARQQDQRWGSRFSRMGTEVDDGDTILPMGQEKESLLDLLV